MYPSLSFYLSHKRPLQFLTLVYTRQPRICRSQLPAPIFTVTQSILKPETRITHLLPWFEGLVHKIRLSWKHHNNTSTRHTKFHHSKQKSILLTAAYMVHIHFSINIPYHLTITSSNSRVSSRVLDYTLHSHALPFCLRKTNVCFMCPSPP